MSRVSPRRALLTRRCWRRAARGYKRGLATAKTYSKDALLGQIDTSVREAIRTEFAEVTEQQSGSDARGNPAFLVVVEQAKATSPPETPGDASSAPLEGGEGQTMDPNQPEIE